MIHQRPSAGPQDISQLATSLSQEFTPKSEAERADIEVAVCRLAERVLDSERLLAADPVATIKAALADIDSRLHTQLNAILHHDTFRAVESAWRGLHHLVNHCETDEMVQVRVMSVSKQELAKTLKDGALQDKIYDGGLGKPGGEPFGCLVGDYYFDHSEADVTLLEKLAKLAKLVHAPFIAGASPALAGVASWRALAGAADLTPPEAEPNRAAWEAFRATEEAKYVALVMPRFLARLPYSSLSEPGLTGLMRFDEEYVARRPTRHTEATETFLAEPLTVDTRPGALGLWCNAAYALAANIGRSFEQFGWCTTLRDAEAGGFATVMPPPIFTKSEAFERSISLELALSPRREAELTEAGLIPLVHRQHTDMATFGAAQSVHRSQQRAATTTAMRLAASLPYVLVSCRFAHYMHCIARDAPNAWRDRNQLERHLTDWAQNYVLDSVQGADEILQAQKPLLRAEVAVKDPDASGRYPCLVTLRPYYRLESTVVTMKLNLTLCAL
jgi:type VI secretion system protein ImpC